MVLSDTVLAHLLKCPWYFSSSVSFRALRPPGWLPQWHCGVRVSSNKKLVGFISAIPADIHIYDTWVWTLRISVTSDYKHCHLITVLRGIKPCNSNIKLQCHRSNFLKLKSLNNKVFYLCFLFFLFFFRLKKMVEINFLCVHKKLRSKRVAPVLIREITRRVNLEGIFQAVYTAGVVLPKPVSTCRYQDTHTSVNHYCLNTGTLLELCTETLYWFYRYWHRSLNPRKLVEVKFSHLSRNMTLQRTMKLYRLPDVSLSWLVLEICL